MPRAVVDSADGGAAIYDLAAHWSEAHGGPSDFTEMMGEEISVVRMHLGKREDAAMDDTAHVSLTRALDYPRIPEDPR